MVLDSLLTFYFKKDKARQEKCKELLNSLKYNEKTKEFIVHSTSIPDKRYIVFYSESSQEWFCECPTILYKSYRTYEDPIERYQKRKKNSCIHIKACMIWKTIKQGSF